MLMMLGSEKTFAEGGYAGTSVAEVLPVALDAEDASPAKPGGGGHGLRLTASCGMMKNRIA